MLKVPVCDTNTKDSSREGNILHLRLSGNDPVIMKLTRTSKYLSRIFWNVQVRAIKIIFQVVNENNHDSSSIVVSIQVQQYNSYTYLVETWRLTK